MSAVHRLRIDFKVAKRTTTTVNDIINLWPTMADFARDVGEARACVKGWRIRNSIPARYHLQVVAAADRHGARLNGQPITPEVLARIAASRRDSDPYPADQAA